MPIPTIDDYYKNTGPQAAISAYIAGQQMRRQADQEAARLKQQQDALEQARFERELARADRQREIQMRAAEWAGPDAVSGADGIDIQATARARQARTEREALAGAEGLESVVAPPRRPTREFMSPEMQSGAAAVGEEPLPVVIEPTAGQLADPAFRAARAKGLEKKFAQDAVLDRQEANAQAIYERAMGVARLRGATQEDVEKMRSEDRRLREEEATKRAGMRGDITREIEGIRSADRNSALESAIDRVLSVESIRSADRRAASEDATARAVMVEGMRGDNREASGKFGSSPNTMRLYAIDMAKVLNDATATDEEKAYARQELLATREKLRSTMNPDQPKLVPVVTETPRLGGVLPPARTTNFVSESASAPVLTPKSKAALANQIAKENPSLTREQVLEEVRKRTTQ